MRQNFSSGNKWEKAFAFSRAVRINNVIEVSGTVSVDETGEIIGINNPYEQTKYIFEKILRYIEKAGGKKEDIIRTRMYVLNISDSEEIGRAHYEFFKGIEPATSMIEVKSFISEEFLVEIEATAVV